MAKVVLDEMNTHMIPIVDCGTYYGALAGIWDDIFNSYEVDIDDYSPDDLGTDEYNDLVRLVHEGYEGTEDFISELLSIIPDYIQEGFDMYGIPAKVIPNSCKWQYAHGYYDSQVDFDMSIDIGWVEDTFTELSTDEDFINYIHQRFSSRSGYISFMPDSIEELKEILDPHNTSYWRLVSEIIQYMINCDEVIAKDVTDSLVESLDECDFVRYRDLGIWR